MIDYSKNFNSGFKKPNTYFELEEIALVDACVCLNFFRKPASNKQRSRAMNNGGRNVAAIKDKTLRQKMISLYERCFNIEDEEIVKLTSEETLFINRILENVIF